jgi:hypothetical protein
MDVNKNTILTGIRSQKTFGLWMFDLLGTSIDIEQRSAAAMHQKSNNNSTQQQWTDVNINMSASAMMQCDNSKQRVQWAHRTYGSPVDTTFINALEKSWIRVMGVGIATIKKHRTLLRSIESAAGHLDQARQNAHSTTKSYAQRLSNKDTGESEVLEPTHIWTNLETNHMDATGRFPVTSHTGKQYILIMYSEGGNYIKPITMKDRTKESFRKAYTEGHSFFTAKGLAPTFQRMDNEISNDLRTYLIKHHITLDLVPPGQHRRNRAERAIRTFKNHFISILAGADPSFPANLWSELIPQAELTINLLRESTCHPRISAWEELNGPFDPSRTPLAPPGMRVTVHEKSSKRASWARHGITGYYTGPAFDTYRSYKVYVDNLGTRDTDTLEWHPHGYEMPVASPIELMQDAARLFSEAVKNVNACSNNVIAQFAQPLQLLTDSISTDLHNFASLFNTPTIPTQLTLDTTVSAESRVPAAESRVLEAESRVPEDENVSKLREHGPTDTPQTPGMYHPANNADIPPGFMPRPQHNVSPPDTTNSADPPTVPTVTHATEKVQRTSSRSATTRQKRANRHKPKRYINAAVINMDEDEARTYMIQHRFRGNAKGARHRRPAPTSKYWRPPSTAQIAQAVKAMTTSPTQDDWQQWATANTSIDLDENGKKLTFPMALKGPDHDIWMHEHGKEVSRLIDSMTARPRYWKDLPSHKKATYYSPQVKIKIKEGVKVYRVRGTIGGNHIDYHGDTQAFTAAMQTIKIMLNAVVSRKAKFMTADIKDFYLGTPMEEHEYMRMDLKTIPLDIQDKYQLQRYANSNGVILMEIMKGIYGLPQAGKLAQDRLVTHLASHGYHQATHTPCLFTHETRDIAFTLVVDDFGIMYTKDEDAQHLLASLRELYIMTEDWAEQQKYVGITIKHDREANIITLSMPGYVEKALARFEATDIKGAHSPIIYVPPVRGQKVQMVDPPPEDSLPLTSAEITRIQEIVGVFLFYSRAVDPTMLTALSKISTQQAAPTQCTIATIQRLLQYAKQMPNNHIIISASDMKLKAQSDASYLSETEARSRAGMLLYFGIHDDGRVHGIIDAASVIIPTVCSSVAEAEYAALFLAGKEVVSARHTLHDLGFPQDSTIINCDNSCAVGIANITVKQKRSKAIDMRYHWIRDQIKQGKMIVVWEEGSKNLADFFTKAHPVWHHKNMLPLFVHTPKRTGPQDTRRGRRIERLKEAIKAG